MIRTPTLVLWATLLLATHTAQAAKVSLARGETSDEAHLPYRHANLRIQYDPSDGGREVIRCVTIRSSRGGPTMLFDVTIPPQAPAQSIDVLIPAMSSQDSCNVRLLSGKTADSPMIAQFDLTIDWPTTSVTAQTFLDPDAYDQGDFLPPVWSDRTLQTVFVTALTACVLLSACLLIKRGAWRMTTAGATLIAAAAGLWLVAGAEPTVIRKELGDDGRLMLVSCLRDATVEIESPHTIPIYYNIDEMSSDRAVVATPGKLLVDLKSGQVRLFAQQRTEKNKAPSGL